jgi:hypothetical protein
MSRGTGILVCALFTCARRGRSRHLRPVRSTLSFTHFQGAAFHDSEVRSNPLGSRNPDMRIRRNLAVLSHNGTLKDAGRCDKQLVGVIAMERLRQLGGFHRDLRMKVQKANARFSKGALYPEPDCPIKLQSSVLHELGDFPTPDDADAEDPVSAKFEKFAVSRL